MINEEVRRWRVRDVAPHWHPRSGAKMALSDVHDTESAAHREVGTCVGCKSFFLDNPEYNHIQEPIQDLAEDAVRKFGDALKGRPRVRSRGLVCYRGYNIYDDMMHVVFYLHFCDVQEHP